MAWAMNDSETQLWTPGMVFPDVLREAFQVSRPRSLYAHNAQFERLITAYVLTRMVEGLHIPSIEAWYCTAAQARSRSLPGALDDLGRCLDLPIQKDPAGKKLIKLLSQPTIQPDGKLGRNRDPELLEQFYAYNVRDVDTERFGKKCTPELTDDEFASFIAAEKINDAGLLVDREFAEAAVKYAGAEMRQISQKIKLLTDGAVETPKQHKRIKEYIEPRITCDAIREAMTVTRVDRRTGEETVKQTFDRSARAKLLALEELKPGTIDPKMLELIELTDDAGRSSVAKFQNMVDRAGPDGRVQGAYMFAGAGQTGRFSSVGLQVHNFPRATAADPDAVRDAVVSGEPIDDVMSTLASMLRPSIVAAPGHTFVCGDWSAIEARVLPWIAGDETVLDVFRQNDADPNLPDIYVVMYAKIFNVDPGAVTKEQRAVGKVIVLSLGYQGGYRALQAMARAYGVSITDDEAESYKVAWRDINPWAMDFWHGLERASRRAVRSPGEEFEVGRVKILRPENAPLYIRLPSGRMLSYPSPILQERETEYSSQEEVWSIKSSWRPKQHEKEWPRVNLYGGLLAENVTQAASADILRTALVDLVDLDWPVVAHTHDEILLEVRDDEVADAEVELRRAMLHMPAWADGLPLDCEIWTGRRYKK